MLSYFIVYSIPAILAINNSQKFNKQYFLILLGVLFSIFIGFRYEVGGDWFNYLYHFNDSQFKNLEYILTHSDPGYYGLNLLMHELDLTIYSVNLICAIIFIIGLLKLASQQFNIWIAIAVTIPYTITVVAMGYTRQAVALGFVMWAIVYLRENKMLGFFILVALAASFHKTAVLMIGLGIFANGGGKFLKVIAVGTIGIGLYDTFLASHAENLVKNYVEANKESSGAFIRTFINLIPAILLIIYRKRWKELFDDFNFWLIIALLSIFSFAIVGIASTAVDRMALYFIPIQIVVFSRLSLLMAHQFKMPYVNLAIIGYYFLILFVWLNFASHAYLWLPYQNILIHDLW